MSMATNYRYEVERPGAKNLRKALKRQEERIKVCGTQSIFIEFLSFVPLTDCIQIISIVLSYTARKRFNFISVIYIQLFKLSKASLEKVHVQCRLSTWKVKSNMYECTCTTDKLKYMYM